MTTFDYDKALLRKNQRDALEISLKNDFNTGIHFHATGAGKSWIAMYLLYEFHIRYPKANIIWICERKDILIQQFSRNVIKDRNFSPILKHFNVLDFVELKKDDWYQSLNCSTFWGKPFLCIINRAFLTNREKYKNIKTPIHLVIHDECHSIENNTTQLFYEWLVKYNKTKHNLQSRIIGFSATPELILPLDNILSKYSIYDGFLDKVILPPKIIWIKSENKLPFIHLIQLIKTEIEKLPYKKIIIWSGIIDECIKLADEWSPYFKKYTICLDFNNLDQQKELSSKYGTFDTFYNKEEKAILFCAVKHREGSDIPNLDGCIFMDMVEHRGERVFIQCMGRVLRHDKARKKKYGLVIDLKAKSTIQICNRVQKFLQLDNIFPWKYEYRKRNLDGKTYYISELNMIENLPPTTNIQQILDKTYTKTELSSYFKRTLTSLKVDDVSEYQSRLNKEMDLIINKKLFGCMIQAIEILEMTNNIPHVTRGSCGSSLVCYLLEISHVDPIKYNISFARFLNQYRDTLPDIDFDFPHYMRDEVFLKLFQKWGNKVARISNHIYYHEKSALREALRVNGVRRFISKYDINREIKKLDPQLRRQIYTTQKRLDGTFKGFSLHCGGIIYFPDGIPEDYILEGSERAVLQQVSLNKVDVSKNKNFKIDILSSRGLSQLLYCHRFGEINFNSHLGDQKTIDLLSNGDNIGITLGETPLMRKAFLLVKPKTIMDVAICLSIIRPAAKDAKKEFELGSYKKNNIIFDDDVIQIMARIVGCDEEMGDKLRRGYCKGDKETMAIIDKALSKKPKYKQKQIKGMFANLRKYGFCKAHALSYAQLVWQLAYQKANHPKQFWRSTLKTIHTCYKKWVHPYEAKCAGISLKMSHKHQSIYAEKRNKKIDTISSQIEQVRKFGMWKMETDAFIDNCYCFKQKECVVFKGLIASSRMLNYGKKKKIVLFLGVGRRKYIEIVVVGKFYFDSQKIMAKGRGKCVNTIYGTIECNGADVCFI